MRNIIQNLSSELSKYCSYYKAFESHGFDPALELYNLMQDIDCSDITKVLYAVQRAERIIKIIKSGIHDNNQINSLLGDTMDGLRIRDPIITIGGEKASNIAMKFYESNQQGPGDTTTFRISHAGKHIVEALISLFLSNNKSIDHIDFDEHHFHAKLIDYTGEKGFEVLRDRRLNKFSAVDKLITIRQDVGSDIITNYTDGTNQLLNKFLATGRELLTSGKLFYTLTVIPTRESAETDNMNYEEYLELFAESIDQPREEIGKAQELLIEKLDAGKQLHIINADGTDITMSIEGMTFANSLISKNIPGAEVFSAPIRNSVDGKIVARGRFQYDNFPIVEDIWMDVEGGEIVGCGARVNSQAFQDIVYKNQGANFFGEIGLGTNPHLQRSFINGLLVEKVSGSFHMAIGSSYKYTSYNGKPVYLDNGNKSEVHRDITTMLRNNNSSIVLDGEVIQEDGKRLDPKLSILNEGWGSLSQEEQPSWWKNKYPQGYK